MIYSLKKITRLSTAALLLLFCFNAYAVNIYIDRGNNLPSITIPVTWNIFHYLERRGYIDYAGFATPRLLQAIRSNMLGRRAIGYQAPRTTLFEALPDTVFGHIFSFYWRRDMPLIDADIIANVSREARAVVSSLTTMRSQRGIIPSPLGRSLVDNLWFTLIAYPAQMTNFIRYMFNSISLQTGNGHYDINNAENRYRIVQRTIQSMQRYERNLPFGFHLGFSASRIPLQNLSGRIIQATPTDRITHGSGGDFVLTLLRRTQQRWHAYFTLGNYTIDIRETEALEYYPYDNNNRFSLVGHTSNLRIMLLHRNTPLLDRTLRMDPLTGSNTPASVFRTIERQLIRNPIPTSPTRLVLALSHHSNLSTNLPYPGFNQVPDNDFIRSLLVAMSLMYLTRQ